MGYFTLIASPSVGKFFALWTRRACFIKEYIIYNIESFSQYKQCQLGEELSQETHVYNDKCPFFTCPQDLKSERFHPQKIDHIWIPYVIPREKALDVKQKLNDFLVLSPQERADYMGAISFLRSIVDADISVKGCDKELLGHRGLFADMTLPAFTILGAYSGAYLTSPEDYEAVCHHFDQTKVEDYLFRVAADHEWPKMSAYRCGNRLTLINAASNYRKGMKSGLKDVLRRQNVIPVFAQYSDVPFDGLQGREEAPNMLFLITCKTVSKNQQFLYDYGPVYWK